MQTKWVEIRVNRWRVESNDLVDPLCVFVEKHSNTKVTIEDCFGEICKILSGEDALEKAKLLACSIVSKK